MTLKISYSHRYIQSVIFPRTISLEKCKTWLRLHGFRDTSHRYTRNDIRFRQQPVREDAKYRILQLPNSPVKFVMMY